MGRLETKVGMISEKVRDTVGLEEGRVVEWDLIDSSVVVCRFLLPQIQAD